MITERMIVQLHLQFILAFAKFIILMALPLNHRAILYISITIPQLDARFIPRYRFLVFPLKGKTRRQN